MSTPHHHALFQHAADGLCLGGTSRPITAVNPAFCRMVGRTEDALIGEDTARLLMRALGPTVPDGAAS